MFRIMVQLCTKSHRQARRLALGGLVAASLLAGGTAAHAQTIATFAGEKSEGGYTYRAYAEITKLSDTQWTLKLVNDAPKAATANPHVLTGFFWQDTWTGAYGKLAASGSQITEPNNDFPNDTMDQHWAYKNALGVKSGIAPNVMTFNQGVGAAGFNIFGPNDAFRTTGNPQSPILNGVDWGILPKWNTNPVGLQGGDDGKANQNPFVREYATFTFGGAISWDQISNARFQYGSGLELTSFTGVKQPPPNNPGGGNLTPEGDGVLLLLAGGLPLVGMLLARRKRTAASAA